LAVAAALGALALRLKRRRTADAPATQPAGTPTQPETQPGAQPAGTATQPETQPGAQPAGTAQPGIRAAAAAGGIAVTLPWLWTGALGGVLETVLALAAAAAVGWFAGRMLDGAFWRPYATSAVRLVLLGGLVAGVALLLVAAGTGQSGGQLPALLVLPPLGFALAGLHALAVRSVPLPRGAAEYLPVAEKPLVRTPVGWLVGIAAAAPLALVDPEEITLVLSTGREVPYWTFVAAGLSLAVALLLGLGYALAFARRLRPETGQVRFAPVVRRAIGAGAVAVLVLAGAVVYLGPGQPGLHGERLFVIMKEQADLARIDTAPTGPAGRDARVEQVYRTLVATADRTQADLRRTLDRWRLPYTSYYLVNAIEVSGGPEVRAWLSRRADVDRVLLSQRLRPLPAPAIGDRTTPTAAPAEPPWGLTAIGADRVRAELGVDGRQITVGSSDSGVDVSHPALAGSFRGGADSWHDPWNNSGTPTDHLGHGTHTLGTAVGAGVGVAPGANWVGCVNLDRNLGNPAYYLDCLQFMLAPFPPGGDPFTAGRPQRAPHVLTNSWGCPEIEGCDPAALRTAATAFAAAGVFFVAAAGNTGPGCGSIDAPPALYPDVLTVGAVDEQGRITEFSSRGPTPAGAGKPDLVAPGADVLSAMPGGGYDSLDGTSMATPHVAGVVALMWSANPALVGDLARTTELLRSTAKPVPMPPAGACGAPANVTGAGTVDAYAAVTAARQPR
jgi:subtilisin family serine protease